MGKLKIVRLDNNSVRAVVIAFALFLLASALSSFGIISLPTSYSSMLLSLTAVMVIFIEIGIVKVIGGKKGLDIFGSIGFVSALIILITTILQLFGIILPALEAIKGITFLVVGVSFVIEAFLR